MRFTYDPNPEIAINSIFSIGLIASGTNHSRLGTQFRGLAGYYAEEPNILSVLRISQGLLHMAKGSMSLDPIHSNGLLLSQTGLAGILVAVLSFTEYEKLICDRFPWLMYSLSLSMKPRALMTLNEEGESQSIQVMVGQGVDTVGMPGTPRTIKGFQVHSTPVLIGFSEKCELDGDEYVVNSDVLEDVVIVKKNPIENRKKIK